MVHRCGFDRSHHYKENDEGDNNKTVFEFKGEVYEWKSMIMASENKPMIMKKKIYRILDDMIRRNVMVYLDDILY